jgi:CBS domain-containing protein
MQAMEAAAHRTPAVVNPDATVAEVARIMLTSDARVVIVTTHGLPVGIVTERDIVARVVARGIPLSTPVGAVMTPRPVTLPASASTGEGYATLRAHRVRQLPLVEDGVVVGLLVRDDLVGELVGDLLSDLPEDASGDLDVIGLYRRCPHCGAERLRLVEGPANNLLCLECRHCWRPERGSLLRVDPVTCPGCPDRIFCRFPLVSS